MSQLECPSCRLRIAALGAPHCCPRCRVRSGASVELVPVAPISSEPDSVPESSGLAFYDLL